MPVSGKVLSAIMDNMGMSNAELARKMEVAPPTVGYWRNAAEVPAQRIDRLEAILGSLGGDEENVWVRDFKKKFNDMKKRYDVSVPELADVSDATAVTIYNILNDRTLSPQEATRASIDDGLDILEKKYNKGAKREQHKKDDEPSFEGGIVNVRSPSDVYTVATPGVYLLYGGNHITPPAKEGEPFEFHGTPEYVGKSKSIGARIKTHEEKWWFRGVDWAAWIEVENSEERSRLEKMLIRLLNPQFNKQRAN